MSWSHPLFLGMLIVPVSLAWFGFRRPLLKAGASRLLRVNVTGSRIRPLSNEPVRRPWLLVASLTLVLLAAAGPRWGARERRGEEPAREILIALDLSRSMLVNDVAPSRLQRAHTIVRQLLDGLHGERVGLILFSGVAYAQVPLSSDYQIIREFLPVLEPGYLPQGGSDYAALLRVAMESFSEDKAIDRFLFVLSDGESTTDGWQAELTRLNNRDVKVVSLGIGTMQGADVPPVNEGEKSPARSRLEPATLQELAVRTHGIYVDASRELDSSGLLARTVELGQRVRWAKRSAAEAAERFQWFLAPAWLLGVLGLAREIAVRPQARVILRSRADARSTGVDLISGRPRGHARFESGAVEPRITRKAGVSAVLILSMIGVCASWRSWAHEEGHLFGAEMTATDRLRWIVEDLADHRSVEARDLAVLGERTINYALETLARGQMVADGAVRDALVAIDFGEKMNSQAADWATMRSVLQRLLARKAAAASDRPPEQKKEPRDEEDRPSQTNGQGSQQTTSESRGQGGVAKTDAAVGELGKESVRRSTDPRPAAGAVRPGSTPTEMAAAATRDPLRALTLRRYREAVKADTPGVLFQALAGDAPTGAAGGRDW